LGVSLSSLKRWRARQQQSGAVQALVAQVRAAPDATLVEHCATWTAATGVAVSPSTMSRALTRAGWPLKKSR
jgi:transposase